MTTFNRGECDRIKRIIRNGGLATSHRGQGKNTAILEVIHEIGAALCVLVVPNLVLASYTRDAWRRLYNKQPPPTIVSGSDGGLQGLDKYVFCDELALCIENNPVFGERYFIDRLKGATL